MIERYNFDSHPFILPFTAGIVFVLTVCIVKAIIVIQQLSSAERRQFLLSLIKPRIALLNVRDIILDCLIHVKLWKRNKVLGYMHSSIAFGWFLLIVLGHIQVFLYDPKKLSLFYYPIFFEFFIDSSEHTIISMMMDICLYYILSGIALAVIKRFYSRIFGMKRTTRHSLFNLLGMYSLWAIFPLRLIAEQCVRSGDLSVAPWWAYSIDLCIFMVILPFSRYLHIPAEMLLITLRNAGLGISQPDKGMARLQSDSCPNCGVCIDVCPMNADGANLRDSTVYLTRQLRRHNQKRVSKISDKCLLCGRCSSVCQVGVDGAKLRVLERERRENLTKRDFSAFNRVEPVGAIGKVLYFSGCMSQLTPQIGKSVESILRKAGINYEWLDRDGGLCCGRPLGTAGRTDEAAALIHRNGELISASGASTLLVSCPICYREFSQNYSLPGITIVHYSSYFNELLDRGLIAIEKGDSCYVYHDPCELGRGCGIYEPPRKLLSKAVAITEAPKNRVESFCCGGSLGSLTLDFERRKKITLASLDNLCSTKADAIATACPLCLTTFSRYSDRPVKDIAQIIDEQIIKQ